MAKDRLGFEGFDRPTANFFRLPNAWTDITAAIDSLAELKVVEYILRHTWGYQEYDIQKHITIDEFVRGRKHRDGTRMDKGTGLSERAVRYGLADALQDGLIDEEVDDSDRGRIKKYYSVRMKREEAGAPQVQDIAVGVQSLHPGVQTLPVRGRNAAPRTEKETLERNLEENSSTQQKIWQVTLADLREQMVPANFARWLSRACLLSQSDGQAVVGVPDQVSADQLARRFDPLVRRALSDAVGAPVVVRYEVLDDQSN